MTFIKEFGLFDESLINTLNNIALNKIGYWDIRVALKTGMNLELDNQEKKECSEYEILDCGIRTFFNGGWGLVTSIAKTRKELVNDFIKAIKLARFSETFCKDKYQINYGDPINKEYSIDVRKKFDDIQIKDKYTLIKTYEETMYDYSIHVKKTRSIYLDEKINKLFINSTGSLIKQNLSYLRLVVQVTAKKNGISQSSINSIGGLGGFEITDSDRFKEIWRKTAKEAVDLLHSKRPISDNYSIILDPKLVGNLIHETIGHSCEADSVLNRETILGNKMGEKIMGDNINIIDNPSVGINDRFNLPYNLFGCYFFDDEGVPAQETKIIENGRLKNYLHNLESASKMSLCSNGHGIADSVVSKPLVRMGFTYLKPKDWGLEEMLEDIKKGLLCNGFQYGYTNSEEGSFSFKTKIAYLIEKGEITDSLRGTSISGSFLEIFKNVSTVGKNFDYIDGLCSKKGQNTPISSGGPYIRVENVKL